MVDVIPIERCSLRALPSVVHAVSHRLSEGRTVVAFPEGTTYCGEHRGRFRPAVFQAAIEAGRPVQPLRISYRHGDGSPSTRTAFLGEETLWGSVRRIVRTPRTVVQVDVGSLQLPGTDRRELAVRCEDAFRAGAGAMLATRYPILATSEKSHGSTALAKRMKKSGKMPTRSPSSSVFFASAKAFSISSASSLRPAIGIALPQRKRMLRKGRL